jgi:hypothetical protein
LNIQWRNIKTKNEKRGDIIVAYYLKLVILTLGKCLSFVKIDIVDDANNVFNKKLIYKVKFFKFRSNV